MARIGILTCSNATQDLGCSAVVCLADLQKRKGAFSDYPPGEVLDLVGIINCPGCPTLTGPDKLLQQIRSLTEFRLDSIHFTYCLKVLCPFVEQYRKELEKAFPDVDIVVGTHEEKKSPVEFRSMVSDLFRQKRKSMVDIISGKMGKGGESESESPRKDSGGFFLKMF